VNRRDASLERNHTLARIQRSKPTQNSFVERINNRLRDECLNAHRFITMAEA
jgi:putative transposase